MQPQVTVSPSQLGEVLLNVATVRPVFLWGAPGIGKSSLVRDFAASLEPLPRPGQAAAGTDLDSSTAAP